MKLTVSTSPSQSRTVTRSLLRRNHTKVTKRYTSSVQFGSRHKMQKLMRCCLKYQ